MDQIGFAIVGAGGIAENHAKAIGMCESARLIAIYDAVPERAKTLAEPSGARVEPDLESLLSGSDVDAIVIATPSGAHMEIAVAAAKAGKHVLCEKPLEVTLERADSIIAACEENGVTLGCIFQSRTDRNVHRVRQALADGRFGKLILASIQMRWYRDQAYYDSAAWRGTWALDGGGALMNQAIHSIDLLCLFAGPPKSVQAFASTMTHENIEVEDTAAAAIQFQNGALGTIEVSTCCEPGFPRRIDLSGETGSVVLEDDRITRWTFSVEKEEDANILAEGLGGDNLGSGAADPKGGGVEGHRRQIADFTEAILQGREPLVPGREARHALELIRGVYKSAQSGQPHLF